MMHPCDLPLDELAKQCRVRYDRRSGPGGQHRNKVETAVILLHEPTGIQSEASERRSQAANRKVAVSRLRLKLALAVRTLRADNSPSAIWKSRRFGQRIRVSPDHEDFPSLLAEALDIVHEHGFDVKRASDVLGVTSSQLIRLIKLESRGLTQLNAGRLAAGMSALR